MAVITRQTLYQMLTSEKEPFDALQQSLKADVTKMRFAEYMRTLKAGKLGTLSQVVSSTLAGTAILAEIIYGSEYAAKEGKVGRSITRTVEFDDDVVVRVPKYEALGYLGVTHGHVGIAPPDSQALPTYTEFTVADDSKTHKNAVRVTKQAINDAKWNEIQNQLYMLGESIGSHENRDIILGFDTASTQAWATDIWVTMVNGRKTMRAAGYYPDTMVVGPTAEALCLQSDKFISAYYLGQAGEAMRSGQIGRMTLGTDVFYSKWVDDLPTEGGKAVIGVLVERQKGVGFGLKEDLQVENYEDVLQGLEGAVATERYDVKIINTTAAIQLLAA
jgi:hypothetical protein